MTEITMIGWTISSLMLAYFLIEGFRLWKLRRHRPVGKSVLWWIFCSDGRPQGMPQ